MRASFVCVRKVSKVESACSGKWSLRVRIVVVSRQNYDKNSPGYIAHGSSYQNTIFSTQISLGLLKVADPMIEALRWLRSWRRPLPSSAVRRQSTSRQKV